MKLKNSFFYTLREDSKIEESTSGNLLVKSGMIKKTSSGVYMYLPLGLKVLENIKNIVRDEMNKAGCNELLMPILTNEEVFDISGRKDKFGKDMFKLNDRYNRSYALGPTHEELFTIAAGMKIKSYKDMPFNIYQFGTKFRDEKRPRFGLIRVREFIMKDAYSFDISDDACDISYQKMKKAYQNIMDRCSLNYKIVKADVGVMGGLLSEEFQALTSIGEDNILSCECDSAINAEVANILTKKQEKEKPKEKELVATPNAKTIEEVSNFLNISPSKTVKTLIYKINNELVMFLIKGDRELNETKVTKLFEGATIEMATDEDLKNITNASFGSLGPIDIDIKIVIDNEVEDMTNFVVGANKDGYHYINANLTDFKVEKVFDIVNVKEGDKCPICKSNYKFNKGIEVGNIFKLGDKYTKAMNITYLDKDNKENYPIMGCYGLGIGRVLASIIEQHHDDKGIIWPLNIAPFKVGIVNINKEAEDYANSLYDKLKSKGISTLLDDRDERPGVKFNDMDLVGIPLRVTIGRGYKDNMVELKLRNEKEVKEVKIDDLLSEIEKKLNDYAL